MAITSEQREARRHSIGSSDIAAILGISRFANAADVWLEKTQELDERAETDSLESGNALEPAILAWGAKELGVEIEESPPTIHRPPYFHANLDALVVGKPEIIEAKSGGGGEGWGEPGTDEVPADVLAQAFWQLFVSGCEVCHVAAALASDYGIRMRLYRVGRDENAIAGLEQAARDFWTQHVEPKIRPGGDPPRLELLKRVRRIPKKVAQGASVSMLVDAWADAKEGLAFSEAHEKACRRALLEAMGDAEGAASRSWSVTYFEQQRAGYPVPPTSFRVLRKKPAAE